MIGGFFMVMGSLIMAFREPPEPKVAHNSILVLELNGIILKNDRLLDDLGKYAKKKEIRAIVIKINSPGGLVGPSEAIYQELKRVREKYKKPVIASCSALAASGGYYVAVAADKIFTNAGSMLGSIGVIMEFANLEKLYDWAKIKRYAITSGKFKDSGSEYREMTPEESELFQNLVSDVHDQFVKAIAEGRHLDVKTVASLADGRVFTGRQAVELGLADQIGTFQDAIDEAAKLAEIKGEPELFEPHSKRPPFLEFLMDVTGQENEIDEISKWLKLELIGKPLYLMPGTWGP